MKKTERHAAQAPALRERYHKSSFFNIHFPDKSGSPLRYNPAIGITAERRPACPGWARIRKKRLRTKTLPGTYRKDKLLKDVCFLEFRPNP